MLTVFSNDKQLCLVKVLSQPALLHNLSMTRVPVSHLPHFSSSEYQVPVFLILTGRFPYSLTIQFSQISKLY